MSILSASENADCQKIIREYQSQYHINALFLVAKQNTLLFENKIGFANSALKKALHHDLPFPIASVTKQFTAAAILILQEENKLSLHEPLIQYLPENHPVWQGQIPEWAYVVTVHQLLTHSSGIRSYTSEKIPLDKIADKEVIATLLSAVKSKPLAFPPGSQYDYNNTGYLLLSLLIQELSDEKDISLFFQNRFFKPLGMNSSFLPTLAEERKLIKTINQDERLPIRYIANLSNLNTLPSPMTDIHLEVPLLGAGAIISTTHDLLKWNQALYQGNVLNKTSLRLMLTPHMAGEDYCFGSIQYGYGIFIDDRDKNNPVYFHNGWIQGIRAALSFSSKNKTSVVCLSNLSPDETQKEDAIKAQIQSFDALANSLQLFAMEVSANE